MTSNLNVYLYNSTGIAATAVVVPVIIIFVAASVIIVTILLVYRLKSTLVTIKFSNPDAVGSLADMLKVFKVKSSMPNLLRIARNEQLSIIYFGLLILQ